MNRLNARERRIVAGGAAVIVALLLVFRLIPAWQQWSGSARQAATEKLVATAGDARMLALFPTAVDTLDAVTSRLRGAAELLLGGDEPSDVAANVEVMVAEMARTASVRLDRVTSTIDTTPQAQIVRARAALRLTTDIAGLADLLRRIEQGPVMVAIRQLSVRPQNVASPADQAEVLSVTMTLEVMGLLRRTRRAA